MFDADFGDLLQLARDLTGAPIAFLYLVIGPNRTILSGPRFAPSDQVVAELHGRRIVEAGAPVQLSTAPPEPTERPDTDEQGPIRYLAGAPLLDESGAQFGALCIADRATRGATGDPAGTLAKIGRQVVAQLELRAARRDLRQQETEFARLRHDLSQQSAQRRKIEQEAFSRLQESERLYRTLGEAVPDFVWACGADGEAIFVNQRWMDYTGLTLTQADRLPSNVLHHPDDFKHLVPIWKRAREERAPYSCELRIRRHDGVYRWFLVRAVPLLDAAGEITRWIGTTTDIHEQKLLEEALRQSESQYRQLTEAMPQLAWIADAEGNPEFFNRGWYDYTGSTPEQMQSSERPTFNHPDDDEHARALWAQAVDSGGPYEVEHRLRGADGSYRWFLVRAVPLNDENGRVVRWFGTCTDIDSRKRAAETERFLADSSAALASSLDYETTLATVARLAVPTLADWCVVHIVEPDSGVRQLAVAHVDPDKVRWAKELQQRYPYEPDAPTGVPRVLRTGRTEIYPEISDAMLVAGARDEEHLRKMRQVGFTSVMLVPMNARGATIGVITFVSAESGRRYTESEMAIAEDMAHSAALAVDNARSFRSAQREIERRQVTEERLRAHQEAIEALNARLRLSVEVTHHHVRNNLQVIMALAQLPIEEGKDTVPVTALGRIEHHTCSLAAMHDLLMERSREEADVGSISARTALEKLMPLLEAIAHGREIRCEAEDVVLSVNEIGSLCILVNEMATNAIKHGKGVVHVTLARSNGAVRLEVSDEGRGFPANFDWRTATGTGLCLIDIAGRHDLGGSVRYENRAEGGGRVVVEFPVSR